MYYKTTIVCVFRVRPTLRYVTLTYTYLFNFKTKVPIKPIEKSLSSFDKFYRHFLVYI